jgi:hypothetical protein
MKRILLPIVLILIALVACEKEFEPDVSGWKAYTTPARRLVQLNLELNGREKQIELPGDEKTGYRYPQWAHFEDHLLLTQITKTERCSDYQIISIDTTGTILDTIFTAPPNTPLNFKLAPNDSLLILKSYSDNCDDDSDNFMYTFFNRYSKKNLSDTVRVETARGIPLIENIWSPDSRKVIIQHWSGGGTKAFVYDLVTKDTTHIDKGSNFIWSPSDNNLVAYIKDYSIYSMNIQTREKEIIYQGKKKRSATEFRWNPTGDFLMIHVRSYLLNVEAGPLQSNKIIYFSIKDKRESRFFYDDQRIHTWKDGPSKKKTSNPSALIH